MNYTSRWVEGQCCCPVCRYRTTGSIHTANHNCCWNSNNAVRRRYYHYWWDSKLRPLRREADWESKETKHSLAQSRCSWPGMAGELEDYAKECKRCSLGKVGKTVHSKMGGGGGGGEIMAKKQLEVDFTHIEKGKGGFAHLVLADVFTKYTRKG